MFMQKYKSRWSLQLEVPQSASSSSDSDSGRTERAGERWRKETTKRERTKKKMLVKHSPSSAFLSHSTNFFICSRKTLFPLARWASLYHFRIASSLKTSAVGWRKEKIEKMWESIQTRCQEHKCATRCWTNVVRQFGGRARSKLSGYNLAPSGVTHAQLPNRRRRKKIWAF